MFFPSRGQSGPIPIFPVPEPLFHNIAPFVPSCFCLLLQIFRTVDLHISNVPKNKSQI
jgi:hypothetical protein